jgi:hypothetical protein
MDTLLIVCGVLLGVSEAMSLIPAIKANGIVQLVIMVLKKVLGK